ncbi:anthranilate synthase component II [Qiania dongpingensis]|uniref:Aminodeoxychorismate/anthranilate synthase component II n=1 Tax=Qiania dongpingensis TaxID=2763669 RepID=A0A7G9G5X7_9FIRM|nr:aminodeoxychorismate/anthranilate synthase component II [Qiania dongpingensis]QNM06209.1 aminodeoxychorismate/anthranilate synthase component II [Qiania dongpingensis]
MYLMIDNYDSFVYNLYTYMSELGREVRVVRNDKITLDEIESLLLKDRLSGIMISPGPKTPEDCGICCLAVKQFAGRVPILGICLGHQIIGHVYGGTVKKGRRPMHGKISFVHNRGTGLFSELPETYRVTRYHSLVVSEEGFPEMLQIDAKSEDGVIMAMSHRTKPVFGVQFHPEAVLTEYGHELLQNYIGICDAWKQGRRYPHADYSEKTAAV